MLVLLGALYLKLFGWKVEGQVANHKKLIFAVAPHTSNLDFPLALAIMFSMQMRISFMAKKALFRWPFGGIMRWLDGVSIDRSKSHGVVEQTVKSFEERDKLLLAIAPEGTRKVVHKWKTGFLQIANKGKIPVQMVAFDYKRRRVVLGPSYQVGDDIDAELNKVLDYFSSVTAKYPHFCDTSGGK